VNENSTYTHPIFSLYIQDRLNDYLTESLIGMESAYCFEKKEANNLGYFINIFAKKVGVKKDCLLENFNKNKITINKFVTKLVVIEHDPIINRSGQSDVLQNSGVIRNLNFSNLVKTLLLRDKNSSESKIYCIILPSNLRLKPEKDDLFFIRGLDKNLELLSVYEINKLGYEIGNLCPFSEYPKCEYCYDPNINTLNSSEVYFGSGLSNQTFKLPKDNFIKLLKDFKYKEVPIDTIPYSSYDFLNEKIF